MTAFVAICGLLTAMALAFILPPLRPSEAFRGKSTSEAEANIAVYQRHVAEMDSDVNDEAANNEESRRELEELEQRLIADLREAPAEAAGAERASGSALLLYGLAVAVPMAAAALYFAFGTPSALQPY